jgi:hypothetical protein
MAEYAVNSAGCWVWLGPTTGRGYAAIRVGKITKAAHRIYYCESGKEIPPGLLLDHKCRNILCVNPDHLEPVTNRENTLRGIGPTAKNALKTRCPKGHLYEEDNVAIRRGRRHCKECQRAHNRKYKRRIAAALAGKD